jgi:hypothetical protein
MKIEGVEPSKTESRLSSVNHALLGAYYGFLMGSAFVVVGTTINRLLYPDLPLGIDWSLFAILAGWVILGLTLVGGIASLFRERFPSLLIGAVVAALVALVSALFFSAVSMGLRVMVLLFALLPIAPMCLPVVWILRWLAEKHEEGLQSHRPFARILPLVLLALLLGAGSGYFLKMSPRAAEATRFMHRLLQTAPGESDNPLLALEGFQAHMSMDYKLFQRLSESYTEGFDLRAEYEDGYRLSCVVVLYPGQEPHLSDCSSTAN